MPNWLTWYLIGCIWRTVGNPNRVIGTYHLSIRHQVGSLTWRKPVWLIGSCVAVCLVGVRMSGAAEVVCEGWLRKSPPEKKLRRYVSTALLFKLLANILEHISTENKSPMLSKEHISFQCLLSSSASWVSEHNYASAVTVFQTLTCTYRAHTPLSNFELSLQISSYDQVPYCLHAELFP